MSTEPTVDTPAALVDLILRSMADASTTADLFRRVAALTPDDMEEDESTQLVEQFVAAGGVKAVCAAMKTHCTRKDGVADEPQETALVDVYEQGCVLLMNFAGTALAGSKACAAALRDEPGGPAGLAASAVVLGVERFAATASGRLAAELGEVCVGALMQLACVDVTSSLAAGIAAAVVTHMRTRGAAGWLMFLCVRTLSWCAADDDALRTLRQANAVPALLHALKQARLFDPECGAPFGVEDAVDQLQVEARRALARLVGVPPGASSPADMPSGEPCEVGLLVLRDAVMIQGLQAKPELNGCSGVIIAVGEPGCGPEAASGRYGVRIALPEEHRGLEIKVKPSSLRLAARYLAAQVDSVYPYFDLEGANELAEPLTAELETKFGTLGVAMHEHDPTTPGKMSILV